VAFTNGMIGCAYAPISVRENNNGALNGSQINQHMMDVQTEVMRVQERGEQVFFFLW
jgi:hypothetical protein